MDGVAWLVRRFGWLALALGALVLSVWLCAPHVAAERTSVVQVNYYPKGTI